MPSLSRTNIGQRFLSLRFCNALGRCCGLLVLGATVSLLATMPITVDAAGQASMPKAKAVNMFATSDNCLACHNSLITPSGRDVSMGTSWQSSMMANSSRDPYWRPLSGAKPWLIPRLPRVLKMSALPAICLWRVIKPILKERKVVFLRICL